MYRGTSILNDNGGYKLTSLEVINYYQYHCGKNHPLDLHNELICPSCLLSLNL